jgi:predicted HTH transcriptional regulator
LENKGWKLERVWSRNWWRDSDKEIERIRQKIEKIRRKDKSEDDDAGLDRGITGLRTVNNEQSSSLDREPSIEELIKNGESNTMEFKASMRWDYAAGQRGANDMGQLAILKTIAAFMNSEGGTLFVGVADNGNILGIEKDFETFSDRKNWDGWQQHLVNIVRKQIGTEFLGHIDAQPLHRGDGKTVAQIKVQKSYKPVFVEYQDNKSGQNRVEFYYRGLNTTQSLNTKEANDYIKQHWKNS